MFCRKKPSDELLTFASYAMSCAFLAIGIYFRLQLYLSNRSLWLDPAKLALNVIEKNYPELTGTLDYGQMAPVGFLLLTKVIACPFGYSEQALLFFPLVCGILSIVVIGIVSHLSLPRGAAFIPVGILALSSTAIFYSAECKQYSTDLLCSALIIILALLVLRKRTERGYLYLFAALAAVGTWFSYTAVILQLGCGLGLAFVALRERPVDRKWLRVIAIIGVLLAANVLLNYLLTVRRSALPEMFATHAGGFAPMPSLQPGWLQWHMHALRGMFAYPGGFGNSVAIPLLSLAVGVAYWVTKKFDTFLILVGPVVVAYALSLLKVYPILTGSSEVFCRLNLYVLAVLSLLMAAGVYSIARIENSRVLYVFVMTVFFLCQFAGVRHRERYYMTQETRPLVKHLLSNKKQSEQVYVYSYAWPAFRYYSRTLSANVVKGRCQESDSEFAIEISQFEGSGRVWFLFSHIPDKRAISFRELLDRAATMVSVRSEPGAYLYCYNFAPRQSPLTNP